MDSLEWKLRSASLQRVAHGTICTIGGYILATLVARLFNLRAWLATDWLLGSSTLALLLAMVLVAIGSPIRAHGLHARIFHGLTAGMGLWMFAFFIRGARIAQRADILLVGIVIALVTIFSVKILRPFIVYRWARYHISNGRHEKIMQFAAASLHDKKDLNLGAFPRVLGVFPRLWIWMRFRIGLRCVRSFSAELALEHCVDESARLLRKELEKDSGDILPAADHFLELFVAELKLFHLIEKFEQIGTSDAPRWLERFLFGWDYLRHTEQALGTHLEARNKVLMAFDPFVPKPFKGWANSWRRSPIESQEHPRSDVAIRRVHERLKNDNALNSGIGKAICLLHADHFARNEWPTWAESILVHPKLSDLSKGMLATSERIRADCAQQMHATDDALEPSDRQQQRTTWALAVAQADLPPSKLHAPIVSRYRNASGQRRMRFPGASRGGIWLGPGKFLPAMVLATSLCLFSLVAAWPWPRGELAKTVQDIHRNHDYRDHPIKCADFSERTGEIVFTSHGGGVHRLDVDTFRLKTDREVWDGPSSDFLNDIAVGDDGSILIQTLPADGISTNAAGVDVQLRGSGRWWTLIGSTGVEPVRQRSVRLIANAKVRGGVTEKLLICDGRVLCYSEHKRTLREIEPVGATLSSRIQTAVQIASDSGEFWIAQKPEAKDHSKPATLIKLIVNPDAYQVSEFTCPFSTEDAIVQLLQEGDTLWVRTAGGGLYDCKDGVWRHRMQADILVPWQGVRSIRHTDGEGSMPGGLWLIFGDEKANVSKVWFKLLAHDGGIVGAPWRNATPATSLSSTDHAAAWLDPQTQTHRLALPRSDGGDLILFSTRAGHVPGKEDGKIQEKALGITERIVHWDSLKGTAYLALEQIDPRSKTRVRSRLVKFPLSDLPEVSKAQLLQQSVELAGGLDDKSLISADPVGRNLRLGFANGRFVNFDSLLHGMSSARGAPCKIGDVEVSQLGHVDELRGRILLTGNGRVGEGKFLDQGPIETELIHTSPSERPYGELLAVATRSDGPDLYFGDAGQVRPWHLYQGANLARDSSLIGFSALLPKGEGLRPGSLTRLQVEKSVGMQVGLGIDSGLYYRDPERWVRLATDSWSDLRSGVGCTFGLGERGFIRLTAKNGDLVAEEVWRPTVPEEPLALPVSGVSPLRHGKDGLLVGHAAGLAWYDTDAREWKKLLDTGARDHHWEFVGPQNENEACLGMWAITSSSKGGGQVYWVGPNGDPIPYELNDVAETTGAGNRLFLRRNDGEIWYLENKKKEMHLVVPKSNSTSVPLKRAAASHEMLYVLSSSNQIYQADRGTLSWEKWQGQGSVDAVEIEVMDNQLVFADKNSKIHCPDNPQNEKIRADWLQKIQAPGDAGVVACRRKQQDAYILRPDQEPQLICGGWDSQSEIGSFRAAASDGDTLYLAGSRRSAFRDTSLRKFIGLGDVVVKRFERLPDGTMLAWDDNGVPWQRVQHKLEKLLENPGDYFVGRGGHWSRLFDANDGALKSEEDVLFQYSTSLPPALTECAPGGGGNLLFKDTNEQLALYDTSKRSLKARHPAGLGNKWQFSKVLNEVHLFDPGGVYRWEEKKQAADLVIEGEDICELNSGIYSRTRAKAGDQHHTLIMPNGGVRSLGPVRPKTRGLQIREALPHGGSLWVCDGRHAARISLDTGLAGPTHSANAIGKLDESLIALVKNDVGYSVKALEGNRPLPNEAWARASLGDGSLLLERNLANRPEEVRLYSKGQVLAGFRDSRPRNEPSPNPAHWIEIDNRFFTLARDASALLGYDPVQGQWSQIKNNGVGKWSDIGRTRDALLLKRVDGDKFWLDRLELKPNARPLPLLNQSFPAGSLFDETGVLVCYRHEVRHISFTGKERVIQKALPATKPLHDTALRLGTGQILLKPSDPNPKLQTFVRPELNDGEVLLRIYPQPIGTPPVWPYPQGFLTKNNELYLSSGNGTLRTLQVGKRGQEFMPNCILGKMEGRPVLFEDNGDLNISGLKIPKATRNEVKQADQHAFRSLKDRVWLSYRIEKKPGAETFGLLGVRTDEVIVKQTNRVDHLPLKQSYATREVAIPDEGLALGTVRLHKSGYWASDIFMGLITNKVGRVQIITANKHRDLKINASSSIPGSGSAHFEGKNLFWKDRALGPFSKDGFARDRTFVSQPIDASSYYAIDEAGGVWRHSIKNRTLHREPVPLPADFRPVDISVPSVPARGVAALLEGQKGRILELTRAKAELSRRNPVARPSARPSSIANLSWGLATPSSLAFLIEVEKERAIGVMASVEGFEMPPLGKPVELPRPAPDGIYMPMERVEGRTGIQDEEEVLYSRLDSAWNLSFFLAKSKQKPPQKRRDFSSGFFDATSNREGWHLSSSVLQDRNIVVAEGRLDCDMLQSCTAALFGKTLHLFALTRNGELQIMQWNDDITLSSPTSIPLPGNGKELRLRGTQLLVRTEGHKWLATSLVKGKIDWKDAKPDWTRDWDPKSPWSVGENITQVQYKGDVYQILTNTALEAIAIGPDLLSADSFASGSPRIRFNRAGKLCFEDGNGVWRSAVGPSLPNPTPDCKEPMEDTLLSIASSRFQPALKVPRRSESGGTYTLLQLPKSKMAFEFQSGRLPHQRIKSIESNGSQSAIFSYSAPTLFSSFHPPEKGRGRCWLRYSKSRPKSIAMPPRFKSHHAVACGTEVLEWTPEAKTLKFSLKNSGIELGQLTSAGLQFDSPEWFQPIIYENGRLRYRFLGQELSERYGSKLWDVKKHAPNSYDSSNVISAQSGQSIKWMPREAGTDTHRPILGRFVDGKLDTSQSFLLYRPEGGTSAWLTCASEQIAVDLRRTRFGWKLGYDEPKAVVHINDGIAVLNDSGTGISTWRREPAGLRPLSSVRLSNTVTQLFRNENGALCAHLGEGSNRVATVAVTAEGVPEFIENDPSRTVYSCASFKVDSSSVGLAVEGSGNQLGASVRNIPGTASDRIIAINADLIGTLDQFGFRVFSPGSGHTNQAVPVPNKQLLRHSGKPLLRDSTGHFNLIIPHTENPGYDVEEVPPSFGRHSCSALSWSQLQPGSLERVHQEVGTNVLHVTLDQSSPLPLDQVVILAKGDSSPIRLVLETGHRPLLASNSRFVSFKPSEQELLQTGSRPGRHVNGQPMAAVPSKNQALILADSVEVIPMETVEGYRETSRNEKDWSLFRSSLDEAVFIERPIHLSAYNGDRTSVVYDRIEPEKLFNKGQLSFDAVIGVSQQQDGLLIVHTFRAAEGFYPSRPKQLSVVERNESQSSIRSRHALQRFKDASPSAVFSSKSVPTAFYAEERIWFVNSDNIGWWEVGRRWTRKQPISTPPFR